MRRNTQLHEPRVVHRPEEVPQICVNYPHASGLNLPPDLAHRIMRRAPRAVPVAAVVKIRLEDRRQPLRQRLLADPVTNSGNAKRSQLPLLARLGDVHPSECLGLLILSFRRLVQLFEVLLQVRLELLQALPIDSGRPSITARSFSSCPSDSASRPTPCPPGCLSAELVPVGASPWLSPPFPASCPFRRKFEGCDLARCVGPQGA